MGENKFVDKNSACMGIETSVKGNWLPPEFFSSLGKCFFDKVIVHNGTACFVYYFTSRLKI